MQCITNELIFKQQQQQYVKPDLFGLSFACNSESLSKYGDLSPFYRYEVG